MTKCRGLKAEQKKQRLEHVQNRKVYLNCLNLPAELQVWHKHYLQKKICKIINTNMTSQCIICYSWLLYKILNGPNRWVFILNRSDTMEVEGGACRMSDHPVTRCSHSGKVEVFCLSNYVLQSPTLNSFFADTYGITVLAPNHPE